MWLGWSAGGVACVEAEGPGVDSVVVSTGAMRWLRCQDISSGQGDLLGPGPAPAP